jgi:glycosyltransferase domain-containing protein
MNSTVSQLTVLLVLKDRFPFTARWIASAIYQKMPFTILVADGSIGNEAEIFFKNSENFRGLSVDYIRYPPDLTYRHYFSKLSDALEQVNTQFVVLADNDDFFVPNGLTKSVEHLLVSANTISCGGQCLMIWVGPNDEDAHRLYGKDVDWKSSVEGTVEGVSALQRFQNQSRYSSDPSYYDVKRTSVVRNIFQKVFELNLNDLFLVEILIASLTAIEGPSARLSCTHIVRQMNSPGSSGIEHSERYGDWFGRMLVDSWSRDFGAFSDTLEDALVKADNIPRSVANKVVRSCYRMQVAPSLLENILDEPTISPKRWLTVGAVRALVRRHENSRIRRLARFIYRQLSWISFEFVHGSQLVARPVADSKYAIEPILRFLSRTPKL